MSRNTRPARARRMKLAVGRLEDRTVPSSVQGTIFNDVNYNQVFDPGESGLPGWTVYVDNNNATILDPGEATAVTDANGHYLIDTTAIPPNSNGYDFFRLDLQVGSGGRWLNTTAGMVHAHPVNEPAAVRDFGVEFQPYVSVEPSGPETLVNMTTAGAQGLNLAQWQQFPQAVAADANGNYVVTWQNLSGSETPTIVARIFNANGTPRTGELTVATANGQYSDPQVAMAENGRFVVAWPSSTPYLSTLARMYNADGTPATSVITVAAGTRTVSNFMTGVAMDAVGNFAVLYKSAKHGQNITVQRYSATGAANGRAIDVFTTNLANGGTSLVMDATGRFVVAWEDAFTDATNNLVLNVDAQRFSAAGQKVGSQILATSAPNPGVYLSSLSMNSVGRFAVAWRNWDGTALTAQVYDWGTPVGGPVTLAEPGESISNSASDIDSNGNVTFAWDTQSEIRFRRFTATGTLEPALMVNTTTQGGHGAPSVAVTGTDRFVVTWQGYGPGDDAGIFMQRFKPLGTSPLGNLIPNGEDVKSAAIWIGDKQIYGNSEQLSQARIDQSPVPIAPSTETPIAKEGNPWFSFDSHTWLAAVTDEALINDLIFVGS